MGAEVLKLLAQIESFAYDNSHIAIFCHILHVLFIYFMISST